MYANSVGRFQFHHGSWKRGNEMRKTSIALSIVSVLLLAVSCKSIPRAELIPIDMGDTEIVNGDGIDWQAASNEEVDVVIQSGFSPDNTQGIMAAGITNKTEDELVFNEADITFYGRKKSGDGEWKEMGQWKKSRQVTRAVFWKIYDVFRCLYSGDPMGIFGTEELLMADYGTRLDIDALGKPYSDSSVTRMNEIKRYSMGWLDENALLNGDTAASGDELVGAFFLTPKKRYTEFKVEYTPSGSTDPVDFYYERSDAELITKILEHPKKYYVLEDLDIKSMQKQGKANQGLQIVGLREFKMKFIDMIRFTGIKMLENEKNN